MKLFVGLAFALILAPATRAQHQVFTVNADASEVKIKLNTTHEVVNGTFHVQSGSINFDHSTAQISGIVVVGAGSGRTGNESRDKKMDKTSSRWISSRPYPLRRRRTPEPLLHQESRPSR